MKTITRLLLISTLCFYAGPAGAETSRERLQADVQRLAAFGDRSTGTAGNRAAADYIQAQFEDLGLREVGRQRFVTPVMRHEGSRLFLPDRGQNLEIRPVLLNAITPQTVDPEGLSGPLVYVGPGRLPDFNGKPVQGAVILMDLDSRKHWLHAANLGARAVIYVDPGRSRKMLYEDKFELSPVQFPRFRIDEAALRQQFGSFERAEQGVVAGEVRVFSRVFWNEVWAENIYGLIPGADPDLAEELLIVEAFYDNRALVPGMAPGADEALSVATLLELARFLVRNPPGRSVLLVAAGGHAQTLAGMREAIWSIASRSKDMRDQQKDLQHTLEDAEAAIALLEQVRRTGVDAYIRGLENGPARNGKALLDAVNDRIKTEVDTLSRRLMRLRLESGGQADPAVLEPLVRERTLLRRLSWATSLATVGTEEKNAIQALIPKALDDHRSIVADAETDLEVLRSARQFRSLARSLDIAAVVSLHLSSGGDGFGAFNYGFLHDLRDRVNRTPEYSLLDDVLRRGAEALDAETPLYRDTLRPSRLRTWQSHLPDRPALGGEVSALAALIGVTFATVNDNRQWWGTPADTIDTVDFEFAGLQSAQLIALLDAMSRADRLHTGDMPRDGLTEVLGRAQFLRQGELFPDQPAPGTVIMAFQGPARYYAIVDAMGRFHFKGVATAKLTQHKVIVEGYRFHPRSGEVVWAINKPETGKSAYRLKIRRSSAETDLVIFGCKETSIFNLLEPRSFDYMTRIQLIDARREASPTRYWWSRIDTRSSVIASVYLEPGTRLKMTLSDSVLNKKLLLLNASEENPTGSGYLVDDWPQLHRTDFKVARDMWALLGPRIRNLEKHGIYNQRISAMHEQGMQSLNIARNALEARRYDLFAEAATRSWALAARVYNDVEKTQKDVLFGVLFYIALFVPFAFCLERLLFSFTNINKRIVAFFVILLALIAVIYNVHPAFRLAYSPTVVILAFLIMGLSLVVTLIIYFRFEEEMTRLQRRARQMKAAEVGRWKAFTAAFLLGVSNLRRRRLRTILTCATLIILTFTVMSFTTVKSIRHHARMQYQPQAPYQGFLFKNFNWTDLPPEAHGTIANYFEDRGTAAPRVWLENEDRTRPVYVPIQRNQRTFAARGLIGLSHEEAGVTGLDRILVGGRWLAPDEDYAILLPERMAGELGIDPRRPEGARVRIWGTEFDVVGVFSGRELAGFADLDGEPPTPVTFPTEVTLEMTEAEMEAMESGQDVQIFQSRYQHVDGELTVIVPFQTLLSMGGRLKAVAARPPAGNVDPKMAESLADRFGLIIFAGEPDGVFLYHASDTMSYSGVPNVLIPLIISVFIVLNTMIGSVYERKREIGIYTSVGLAPSHVSFLFIAEALAFAVLSVVLGYLLAQTTAAFFAGTGLWSGITVNYSSMAGVGAMVLVILVVLVSVIYPSRVAADIAIPDVNRSWKLPEAKDNRLDITLPFLMNFREHLSIGGFLLEHFEGHQDISHGLFSAGGIDFSLASCRIPGAGEGATGDAEMIQLSTNIWLAPFDFGIMQQVSLEFCEAVDDPGFLEIRVRLERLAGEANAWRRINKAFLHDLRKQLLIWRSLDKPSKAHYEELMIARARERNIDLQQHLEMEASG
ncbi:MAG TPA: FtsX-like permease family protein [Desulfobacterales bacterium]